MILHHIAIIVSSEKSLVFYKLLGFNEVFRKVRKTDTVVLMEGNGIISQHIGRVHVGSGRQGFVQGEGRGTVFIGKPAQEIIALMGGGAFHPIAKPWIVLRGHAVGDGAAYIAKLGSLHQEMRRQAVIAAPGRVNRAVCGNGLGEIVRSQACIHHSGFVGSISVKG